MKEYVQSAHCAGAMNSEGERAATELQKADRRDRRKNLLAIFFVAAVIAAAVSEMGH